MVWHRLAQHLTNKGLRLAFTGGGGEVEGKRIADVARFLPRLLSKVLGRSFVRTDGGTASTRGALCRRRHVDDPRRGRSGSARSCSLRTYFGLSLGAGALRGFAQLCNHVSLQRSKTVTSRRIPTTPTVVNAVPDTRRIVRARATRVSRCASRRCRRTSWSRKSTAFWQAVPTRRSPSAPGLRIFPRNQTEKTVARRPGTV